MDCMQSFTLRLDQPILLSGGNGVIKSWGTAGQYYWSASNTPSNATSTFNLQGFKNPNIYGMSVVGFVHGDPSSINACAVVSDWAIKMSINGTAPLPSGNKLSAPDGFLLYTTSPLTNIFSLSKYTPSIMFSEPYQSVTSITFDSLETQGIGAEFLNVVALNYDLSVTFYYQYEGE